MNENYWNNYGEVGGRVHCRGQLIVKQSSAEGWELGIKLWIQTEAYVFFLFNGEKTTEKLSDKLKSNTGIIKLQSEWSARNHFAKKIKIQNYIKKDTGKGYREKSW